MSTLHSTRIDTRGVCWSVPECGAGGGNRAERTHATNVRARVTCKRCLASLAKRDREFRRKARARFRSASRSIFEDSSSGFLERFRSVRHAEVASWYPCHVAYCAVAVEEGELTKAGIEPLDALPTAGTVESALQLRARAIAAEESRS